MNLPSPSRLAALLLSCALLSGCDSGPRVYGDTFTVFGDQASVELLSPGKGPAEAAIRLAEMELQRLEAAWHVSKPGPMGFVNQKFRTGRDRFKCPDELRPLIEEGQRMALLSDHLFNPAIGDLIAAWGFHGTPVAPRVPPSKEAIEKLLAGKPRMDDIYFGRNRISSANSSVQLDLGDFAKGFAVDRAIDKLQKIGIPNAIVRIGGIARAYGTRGEAPWPVEIRDPLQSGLIAGISLGKGEAAAVLSDADRAYESGGQRIHPIIDPRTGYPAKGSRSVAVLHPDAATAAAAATALFVAGPDDWYRIARQMGVHYALLIDDQGRLLMNPEMKERLNLQRQEASIVLSESLADAAPKALPNRRPAPKGAKGEAADSPDDAAP